MKIEPSRLQGELQIPPSKSHTLRAILFAALARGVSWIEGYLVSPDTAAMVEAVRLLGAEVVVEANTLVIRGCAGKPKVPDDCVQCGNSGLVLRLVGAVAGLIPHYTILTGDASIRSRRVVQPLLDGLTGLGAFAVASRGEGHAPIVVRGPFTREITELDGRDSQPVSGLLIAGAFAPHPVEIRVTRPGEKPWVGLTLDWFKRLGIPCDAENHSRYRLAGSASIEPFSYRVPGDLSTLAYPLVAALLTDSELLLHNVDLEDAQGDKALVFLLQQMGARLIIDRERKTLAVQKGTYLQGMKIDVNDCIDALPILAVVGTFAAGATELVGGTIARQKESDRIGTMARELRKMGAQIEERDDGLRILPSPLSGASLCSASDHRVAMSLAVAALRASSPSYIDNFFCVAKTYPNFSADFQKIGAKIDGL